MFGVKMQINTEKASVLLRPASKNDLPELVNHWSSIKVHLYTMGLYGQTLENEEEWYDKTRKSDSECVWFLQPKGHKHAIGVFGLHSIHRLHNTCTAGLVIWDQSWWGKGIASATHLGGMVFAADFLNRLKIEATIYTENSPSLVPAERVGYTKWGTQPLHTFRAGRWMDAYHLIWLHPEKYHFYYPDGLPEKFAAGVERARVALDTARQVVEFL